MPSSPMMCSTGTRTSSKVRMVVSDAWSFNVTIFIDQTLILTCIPIFEMADLVIPLVSMGTTIRDLFW